MWTLYILLIIPGLASPCDDAVITSINTAVTKTVQFVTDNYLQMNIDGIFSLAIAYGVLNVSVPDPYVEHIDELRRRIKLAYDLIYPTIELETELINFKNYMLDLDMWIRPPTYGTFKLNNFPPVHPGSYDVQTSKGFRAYLDSQNFSKGISDYCILELLSFSSDRKLHQCPISSACRDFFLSKYTEYNQFWMTYGVTHRLLYLQIGRARNCSMDLNYLKAYVEEDCSYIFWELRMNRRYGFYTYYDDLFLEQISLCGFEGFRQFFQRDYLKHVLRVQHKSGCFGDSTFFDLPSRKKRGAYLMLHGCNSHSTGLGITALAEFLVHEIEMCQRK